MLRSIIEKTLYAVSQDDKNPLTPVNCSQLKKTN